MNSTTSSLSNSLVEKFTQLSTPRDVADLLEVPYQNLTYYLYRMPEAQRYTTFKLAKASGGFRIISVPNHSLKILQQKLNHILQMVYQPKASVHGFLQGKSILTNAERHVKRKYVLNLDIAQNNN